VSSVPYLPREIIANHILVHCDIDTRRAFKIPPRPLRIDKAFSDKLDVALRRLYASGNEIRFDLHCEGYEKTIFIHRYDAFILVISYCTPSRRNRAAEHTSFHFPGTAAVAVDDGFYDDF
jgi:hypothetical protein